MNITITSVRESTPETIHQWLSNNKAILVDVRETSEYEQEHIPGSLLVPLSCFEADVFPKFESKILVLHCAVGKRSAAAAKQLIISGYPYEIVNMEGGIRSWKNAGLNTECLEEDTYEVRPRRLRL